MTLGTDFKHRELVEKRSRHVTTRVERPESLPPRPTKPKKPKKQAPALTTDVANAIEAGVSKFDPEEPRGPHGRWVHMGGNVWEKHMPPIKGAPGGHVVRVMRYKPHRKGEYRWEIEHKDGSKNSGRLLASSMLHARKQADAKYQSVIVNPLPRIEKGSPDPAPDLHLIEKKSKHVTGSHVPQRKKRPPAVQAYMTPDVLNAVTAGMSKAFNPAEPRGPHGRWIVGIGVIAKDSLGSGKFIHGVEVNGQPYEWQSPVASHPILAHTAERAQVAAKAAAKHASAVFADPQTQVEQMDNGVLKVTYSEKGRQVERRAGRIPSDLIHKAVGMSKTAPDPAPDEHLIGEIEKHGTKGRPGYRLLHPGVGTGFSHRFESRGLSQKYKRARHENLKPRPLSGLGAGKGKFKNFMERDRRQLSDSKISADVRARMSPDQRAAAAAYEKSKAKYDGYGAKILAAKKAGNFTTVKAAISRDKTLIPEHKKALLEAIAAEEKKAPPAKAAKKAVAAPKAAAKKVASAKPADNKEVLARDLHRQIDAAQNTAHLEHIVDAIDQHGQRRELRAAHIDALLNHAAERHVQHREERLGLVRPKSLPPANKVPAKKPLSRAAKMAAAKVNPASVRPKAPTNMKRGDGPNHVVVSVDKLFNDPKAFDAFLSKGQDDVGRKMFDPQRGDVLHVENNGPGAADFIKRAKAKGINVVEFKPPATASRAQEYQDKLNKVALDAEAAKGRMHVVAFRPAGGTLAGPDQLPEQFLQRVSRRHDEGVLVINPGYRAETDKNGQEIDPNAFGFGPAELRSRLGVSVAAPLKVAKPKAVRVGDPSKPADGPDGNWVDAGPPWPAAIRSGTPAAEHFANGGSLADAPSEGLFDYIFQQDGVQTQDHRGKVGIFGLNPGEEGHDGGNPLGVRPTYRSAEPDRFRVLRMDGGISSSYSVVELDENGDAKSWRMFKLSNGAQSWDIEDEVLVNQMLTRMGVAVPEVKFARDPGHLGPRVMVSEHGGVIVPGFDETKADRFPIRDAVQVHDKSQLKPNRDKILLMDMLDWVIENGDRHEGNWMVALDPQGEAHPVIIDNGGAKFHGLGAGRGFTSGRAGRYASSLYRNDADSMMEDIKKIQAQFKQLDVDELINEHINGYTLSTKYEEHLIDARHQLNERIKALLAMSPSQIAAAYNV